MSFLIPLAIMFAAQTAPVPVILDTDLGDDIDDTWALCMMTGTPELDVKLITTASDNTPKKTLLAAKVLKAHLGKTIVLRAFLAPTGEIEAVESAKPVDPPK